MTPEELQRLGFVPDELSKDSLNDLGFIPDQPSVQNESQPLDLQGDNDFSIGKTLANVGRGVGQAVGSVGDFALGVANNAVKSYRPMDNIDLTEINAAEIPQQNFAGQAREGLKNLTDGYTEPSNKYEEFAGKVGEYGTLGAATGGLAGVAGGVGAATADELLKDVKPYKNPQSALEYGANALADFSKMLAGDIVGRKALDIKTYKNIAEKIANPTSALAAIKANPDEYLNKTLKELDIPVTMDVLVNSPQASFVANNVGKSMFVHQTFEDVLKNTNQTVFNKLQNNLENVSAKLLNKDDASQAFKTELEQTKKSLLEQSSAKYAAADDMLTSADKVIPRETLETIKQIEKKIAAPDQSASRKAVQASIDNIKSAWAGDTAAIPMNELISPAFQKESSNLQKLLKTQNQKNAIDVPLQELSNQRSNILDKIDYEPEAKGARNFLNLLAKSIEKDIQSSPNKAYLAARKDANLFYKTEIANRVRSDTASALLKGTFPKEAYAFMRSPQSIDELSRILGSTPRANQVLQDLKRAKLEELIVDKIKTTDGISYANLNNLFDKRSTQQPLLQSLLGNQQYNNMKKLAEAAKGLSSRQAKLLNTSNSANAAKDYALLTTAIMGAGAGLMGNLKTAAASIGPIVLIKKVTKAMADPKKTEKALKFIEQAKNKKSFKSELMKSIPNTALYAGLN